MQEQRNQGIPSLMPLGPRLKAVDKTVNENCVSEDIEKRHYD